tara:strand:+ start:74 stop:1255 length:1182 start_codon:yes stop_codon:yes gene_type:complete
MYYLENILIVLSILIILFVIIYKSKYTNETFQDYNNVTKDVSELKKNVENLQIHYHRMNKYKDETHKRISNLLKDIDNNKNDIDNTNRKFTDYESIFGKFVENSKTPGDTIMLCNKKKECVEMSYDNDNEYNIKTNNIKIKNEKNEIMTNIKNNEIYFGGDKNYNSPLYIKDDNVYSNKLNVSDLYIKDYNDSSKLLYINDYIKWVDKSIKFSNNMDKISEDNNNKRIKDINELENEIGKMKTDRNNLYTRLNDNSIIISDLKMDYQNYKDINTKFSDKYTELSTDLSNNIATMTENNKGLQVYEQKTNKKIEDLNQKIDNVTKKTHELLEKASLQREIYNKINDIDKSGNNQLFDKENKTLENYKFQFDKLLLAAVNLGIPKEELVSSSANN